MVNVMELDGIALPITPYCGCGMCLVGVRRLSRKSDATSSPERQGRQVIDVTDLVGGHIIGWADDWEVSGAVNPLERPALGPWLRDEMGPYSGIVGPDVSRIGRDVRDALNTGWMMKDTGRLLVTANHGVWDLTDPAQENQFIAEAWGAQMELRNIQKRNSDAAVNARASGRPRGPNSYGYRYVRLIPTGKIDHVEIDREAAEVIRDVKSRILEDESGTITIATEAARLNRAGVLSPKDHRAVMYGRKSTGGSWTPNKLKYILTSYAALGYLIHQEKPVLGPDGHPVQLAEPLWDEATRSALIAKLAPRQPWSKKDRAPRGVRLLAGLVFCGTCHQKIIVGSTGPKQDRRFLYHCTGRIRGLPASQHCQPAPSMDAVKLEKDVTGKFLAKWGGSQLLRREFDPGTGYAARIAELERDRARLESDRAAGLYDRADDEARFRENHKRMGAEIDRLKALPDRPAGMEWVPTGERVADQWAAATDDAARREILNTYGIRVVLYPNDGTRDDRVWVHALEEHAEGEMRRTLAEYDADQAADDDGYLSEIATEEGKQAARQAAQQIDRRG